ncbi:MAG: hypothetical protein EHM36_13820 [Deltaproteobacteria bacterium]|nr:MAG: hypothetical protein EHM36_13820 [Deltaproteobacteria bacterium]
MSRKCCVSFLALVVLALWALPMAVFAKEAAQDWELVNPEGVVKITPMEVNPHPKSLEGKTILLRWNGKHNGDNFLTRVGELLKENVKGVKIVKSWEVAPWTAIIAGNPDKSNQIVDTLAKEKPDIVIASQCD